MIGGKAETDATLRLCSVQAPHIPRLKTIDPPSHEATARQDRGSSSAKTTADKLHSLLRARAASAAERLRSHNIRDTTLKFVILLA